MGDCNCGGTSCSTSCRGGSGSSPGGDNCQGCTGTASGGSSSCGNCGGNCGGGNCGAGCGPCGGCGNSCGSCDGSCGDACERGCQTTCGENCEGGCMTECGSYCTGQAQAENFAKLKLEKKFVAENITFISDFIDYEVKRREIEPLELKFSPKERLDEVKINQIIAKLKEADPTIDADKIINISNAVQKQRGLKSLGESLIEKATILYQTDFQAK